MGRRNIEEERRVNVLVTRISIQGISSGPRDLSERNVPNHKAKVSFSMW
jgi:uncharacterized NAD-dependent epimerase/dehydratase family protein